MFRFAPEEVRLLEVARREPRYGLGAYDFVREAVSWASHVYFATGTHVTGPELVEAVARLATERWGALARDVLEGWDVRSAEDLGEIVFRLVDAEILAATEDDRPEDFAGLRSFEELFPRTDYWRERLEC